MTMTNRKRPDGADAGAGIRAGLGSGFGRLLLCLLGPICAGAMLAACAGPLTDDQRSAYRRIAVVFLVEDRITFTSLDAYPAKIERKTEAVPDWALVEEMRQAAGKALDNRYQLVALNDRDPAFRQAFTDYSEASGTWPALGAPQKLALEELAAGAQVDAFVLIETGAITLGEDDTVSGAGLLRCTYLCGTTTQSHAFLYGRVIDGKAFAAVAYTENTGELRPFESTAWGFGRAELTAENQEALKQALQSGSRDALVEVLESLGLIGG